MEQPDQNIQDEETLASVSFEKANQGKKKLRDTKNELRDAKIKLERSYYLIGDLTGMEYLLKMMNEIKNFND